MLVTYFVNFRQLNDHLFGKEQIIRFTASAFRKLLSIYVFSYFPFGFEGKMWDLIVSVPDHCLSFYLGSLFVKGLQVDAQRKPYSRVPRGKGSKQTFEINEYPTLIL